MADDNPNLTDTPSDNGAGITDTQAIVQGTVLVTGSHFRTLFFKCNNHKISQALASLSAGWDGWETNSGLRVAWRYQSSTLTPRLNLDVLNDPLYPHQYTLGTIEAVDLPDDTWAVTFTKYKWIPLYSRESQAELDRQKLRQELFEEQTSGVESHLCDGQSLDRVTQGITQLKGLRWVTVVDHSCHADGLPELEIECAGTSEQVRLAVANLTAQWRYEGRIHRVTPKADGSYSIWSKPHGWHQSDIPADVKLDLSHRECGELWVIDRPDGKVNLIFRAIQKSTSVDWLKRWQVALPFVCWAVRELIDLKFIDDYRTFTLPQAFSSAVLENDPELLPPVPTDEPASFQYPLQSQKGAFPMHGYGGDMLFPSDAPTLFQHVSRFLKGQKNTAYVQPTADDISWHIQYHTFEEDEPIRGLEYVAELRAFSIPLEHGKDKPRVWRYDPEESMSLAKADVSVRLKRVSDSSCLVITNGWTQAGKRVLEKLNEYIKKLYPPEKYAPLSKATDEAGIEKTNTGEEGVGTSPLVGQPNHDIQKRRNAIRELLSKSNYMDFQLVQLLNEKYGIDASEATVKRDRMALGLSKR